MLGRAWRRNCPRCGHAKLFQGYADLVDRCPGCGLRFEREPGYWVGAMIIVTILTFGVFLILLVGGIVLTWPEVPWGWLLGMTLAANLAIPLWLYGRAKLIWSALELSWHPLEPAEIEAAADFVAGA